MAATPEPRSPLRRRPAWAWLRLVRPLALAAGVATAVGFAFIAAGGEPNWHQTLRIGLAFAALLASAAALNDAADAPHDKTAHLWRPIPSGFISADQALRLALVLGALAFALAGSLGWRPLLIFAVGLLAALLYTTALKRTVLSWLPFSLAFALLPIWVYDALDRFDDVLWWSFPVGFAGGLAFYLAYKLPDFERDDQDGERNVLHWLTIDFAVPAAWGAMAAYLVVAVASANVQDIRAEWLVPPAAIALTLALGVITALTIRVTERRLLVQRWLTAFAVLALALGWLGSITP